jgi:hypothetical protein
MPRGKQWAPVEVAALARAFVQATNNPIKGADQRTEVFIADIMSNFKRLAPAGLLPTSFTYHYRQDNPKENAYFYLRDTVFKDIMKFNSCLRIVYSSQPTGTNEQNKINMAVAIHMKRTNRMNYKYKDFDAVNEWRFYLAWCELKELPKFHYTTEMPGTASAQGTTAGDENANENNGITDENTINAQSAKRRETARGGGSGSKKAKLAKQQSEEKARKEKRLDAQLASMLAVSQERLKEQKSAGATMKLNTEINMLRTGLIEYKDDPVVTAELRGKLLEKIRSGDNPIAATTTARSARLEDSDDDSVSL